jgi:hypothetical protein
LYYNPNIQQFYGTKLTTATVDSAYDCCASCFMGADCQVTAFKSGTCYTFTNSASVCPAQSATEFAYTEGPYPPLIVSNGNCGYVCYNKGVIT